MLMPVSLQRVRYLLLQVRKADDPMRRQEVRCFARALECAESQFEVVDLIAGVPADELLARADVVLLGGSGDFSVAGGGSWLPAALVAMQKLCDGSIPTFASCWGFQALSKALGGEVVTDQTRAELGTVGVRLTAAGLRDPVFASLGPQFDAQMGHQDIVTRLPRDARLLASSDRVENQAFCLPGKPIYATQFHPELDQAALIERVHAYPQYIRRIAGTSVDDFIKQSCRETPQSNQLLKRFVAHVLA